MILYHGSNQPVLVPDLKKSRPGKDFGQAFYLSDKRQQAVEMAEFKVQTFGGEVAVSSFLFDETKLTEGITFQWAFCSERAINELHKL